MAGVAGQGFHAIGRFLIQLPVEDELIEPVKESQGSFCPVAPVLFQGFRQGSQESLEILGPGSIDGFCDRKILKDLGQFFQGQVR